MFAVAVTIEFVMVLKSPLASINERRYMSTYNKPFSKKMFRKIGASLMALAVFAGTGTVAPEALAATVKITENMVSFSSNEIANTFFDGANPRFGLKIENPHKRAANVTVAVNVTNQNNEIVWSKSERIPVSAYGYYDMGIVVDPLPYGYYNINANITANGNTITKSAEFVCSVSSPELNEWASFNYHLGDLPAYPNYEDLDKNLYLTKKMGFSRNRDDIRWDYAEVKLGEPKLESWQRDLFDRTLADGQKSPLYILNIYSMKYNGYRFPHAYDEEACKYHPNCKGNPYTFEQQVEAYAKFCAAMARELKGTKPVFELGNEPDIWACRWGTDYGKDWQVNYNGADYAKLVIAGYDAIKAVDPEATVISAGLCQIITPSGNDLFAQQMLSVKGITEHMDGFAFHPYAGGQKGLTDELKGTDYLTQQIRRVKYLLEEAMKRDGTSGKKIWLSEYGSCDEDIFLQAAVDVRTMITSRSESIVEMINMYNLVEKGTDLSYSENRFGIIRKNYTSSKPALASLANMNKQIAGYDFKDCINEQMFSGERNFSAYGFKRETPLSNNYTYAVWGHTGKNATVTVNSNGAENSEAMATEVNGQAVVTAASNASVEVYDMYGNYLGSNGTYNIGINPVYVVANTQNGTNTVVSKNENTYTVTGTASKAGADVTLLVRNEASLEKKYVAIDQCKANNLSEYSFTFNLPEDTQTYSIYVFDGSSTFTAARAAELYNMSLKYFVNGTEVENIGSLSDTDTVSVKLTLDKSNGANGNLCFYGAVKNGETLVTAKASNVAWNENGGTAEIELGNVKSKDAIALYLWDNNMVPVTPSLKIEQ